MPTSASITSTPGVAFTLPVGAYGFEMSNASGEDVQYRMGATVATSGDNQGLPLDDGISRRYAFRDALRSPLQINAVCAGGTATLAYQVLTQAVDSLGSDGGGGGGGATAWGAITGTLSAQTDLQAALDARVLTANTSLGGNGTADSGKVPLFTANGGLTLGSSSGGTGNVLAVQSGSTNYAIEAVTNSVAGTALHLGLNAAQTTAIATHLNNGSHIAFDIDGTIDDGSSTGIYGYMPGPLLIAADASFNEKTSVWAGKVRYTVSDARAASYTDLAAVTPTGARAIQLPDASGTVLLNTLVVLPGSTSGTSTIVAPAVAGTTTITLPGVTSTLATLGANIFTAGQTLSSGRVTFGANASLGWDGTAISVRNAANSAYVRLDASVLFGTSIVASGSSVYAVGGALMGTPGFLGNGGGVQAVATGYIGFSSTSSESGTPDVLLRRGGAAILQQGTSSATPIAQTYKGPNGSGSNVVGGKLCIGPGQSTGSATPAVLALQGTAAGASSSTAQTLADVLTVTNSLLVTLADGVNLDVGSSTGTQIGTSALQKLALWGASPVVQPAAIADIALSTGIGGGDTVDATVLNSNFTDLNTKINDILAKLRSPGFIAT